MKQRNYYVFSSANYALTYLLIKLTTVFAIALFGVFADLTNPITHSLFGILFVFAIGFMLSMVFWDYQNPHIRKYFDCDKNKSIVDSE